MARILGPKPSHAGELRVVDALQRGPTDWRLLPNFSWISSATGNRIGGELDLIVLGPDIGLVAVEIKSRKFRVDEAGRWSGDGGPESRSPELQVSVAANQLGRYLDIHGIKQEVKTALVFTEMSRREIDGLPIESATAFAREDLGQLSKALAQAFAGSKRPVAADEVTRISAVLAPRMGVLLPLASELANIDEFLEKKSRETVRYTEAQANAMLVLNGQKSVAATGPAGTGKTLVAVERAAALATSGHRTAYILGDGSLLAERLRLEFERRGLDVQVMLGSELLARVIKSETPDWKEPVGDQIDTVMVSPAQERWRDLDEERFDAAIVDEAQLLEQPDRILRWLKRVPLVYFFGDPNQVSSFNDYEIPSFDDSVHLSLEENCRNTSTISDAARAFTPWIKSTSNRHGPRPIVFASDELPARHSSAVEAILHLLREDVPLDQIALLAVSDLAGGAARSLDALRQLLETRDVDPDLMAGFCTPREFIGCDASAIVMVDCGRPPVRLWRRVVTPHKRTLYLAITRARGMLVVVTSPKGAKWLQRQSESLELYEIQAPGPAELEPAAN